MNKLLSLCSCAHRFVCFDINAKWHIHENYKINYDFRKKNSKAFYCDAMVCLVVAKVLLCAGYGILSSCNVI